MPKFQIVYLHHETEEVVKEIHEFKDTEVISAKEWAEDYAYTMADKGYYIVFEIKDLKS